MALLLQAQVFEAATQYGLKLREMACDPDFADTAAFNEKYGFTAEQGANAILVVSKKVEPPKYALCLVLASTRLDVNSMVTKLLEVKRASFADSETTKEITGMEIGGVTPLGVTACPIYIDEAVMQQPEVVIGGGNRTSKIVLDPQELLKLPNVEVFPNLAKQIAQV